MQKLTTCLWFDNEAEEAAAFYVSIFKDSKIGAITRYGKEGYEIHGRKEGTVMTITFEIEGREFLAMNGGPVFTFNEAVSFVVNCKTQEEIDYYWNKLSARKDSEQCGWLKDKYGVSWQIVPTMLDALMADPDREKADRVMHVLLKMKKLDIAELQKAYNEKS